MLLDRFEMCLLDAVRIHVGRMDGWGRKRGGGYVLEGLISTHFV